MDRNKVIRHENWLLKILENGSTEIHRIIYDNPNLSGK